MFMYLKIILKKALMTSGHLKNVSYRIFNVRILSLKTNI